MDNHKNAEYWAERANILAKSMLERGEAYKANMERQFAFAIKEIEKDTANFYRRFAVNNDISLSEAKRLLNTKELAEFRWTVQDYIRYGEDNAISGNWKKQLENASARVHIARYDSLKLQIQHQAEILYANQLDSIDDLAKSIYYDSYYHTAFEIQKGFGVGYALMDVNSSVIEKVLSKPWTADDRTFRDRCWVNKEDLVNSVNTHLTQMIIRGESPDKTIAAIAKDFNVSKAKAGRIVMTESAAFASAGQRDCYSALGVEEFVVVETLDLLTCEVCSAMDGKVFKHSDFKIGVTVPPFHPNCRGTTAPYFNDEFEDGTRFARGVDGKGYQVDGNMTYDEWKSLVAKEQGQDKVGLGEKKLKNSESDRGMYEEYKLVLGKSKLKSFANFQNMKYNGDIESWVKMKRNYKLFSKIDNTPTYSPEYKHKLKETYLYFKDEGFEFTEHALGRVIGQKSGKGKRSFENADALMVLRQPPNFMQEDGKLVRFYNDLAIIQASDTNEIVSIVVKNKARSDWKEI